MIGSPFDKLPPPDPKKFAAGIKEKLQAGLKALLKFSDSARRGEPEWPNESVLVSIQQQIDYFRELLPRGETAKPFQVIREIDRRWEKLRMRRTLDGVVKEVEAYLGRSPLSEMNSATFFSTISVRKADAPKRDYFVRLIKQEVIAKAVDLDLFLPLLPPSFRRLWDLINDRKRKSALPSAEFIKIQDAFARLGQDILTCELRLWEARRRQADPLRKFIFEVGTKSDRKQLFGYSKDEIEEWKKAQMRQATRIRVQKLRDRRKKARL